MTTMVQAQNVIGGTKFLYRNIEYLKLSKQTNPLIVVKESVKNPCLAVHVDTGDLHVFTTELVEIKEK